MGGAQDIDGINLPDIRHRHTPDDARVFGNHLVEFPPLRGWEFLRIVQALAAESFGENHHGRRHGTCQWPAARLIDAGDGEPAGFPVFFLEGQIGHAPVLPRSELLAQFPV